MKLRELLKELRAIVKVHPEAKEADVWLATYRDAVGLTYKEKGLTRSHYIRYDSKHKPARILLEDS